MPYQAATKRTKELTLVKTTDITFATTGASLGTYAIPRASVIFYADSAGNWRMRFNISMVCSSGSRADVTATFVNVIFKNVADFKQAITVTTDSASGVFGFAAPNTATITMFHGTSTTDEYNLSGDVELNAEPTTYTTAANMEGVVAADVYIPPASASVDGIVNRSAQTIAGDKNLTGQTTVASGAVGSFAWGAGTPTGISSSEVTIIGTSVQQYIRVGNQVSLMVRFSSNNTGAAGTKNINLALPIASNLTDNNLFGTVTTDSATAGRVYANTSTDEANIEIYLPTANGIATVCHIMYTVA